MAENSDINLKNLVKPENGMPPPKVVLPKGRGGKKRQPNKQRGGRISARRIGGPNLQQQFLNYKNAKMGTPKETPGEVLPTPMSLGKSGGRSSLSLKPPKKGSSKKSLANSTLPRVQELGVTSIGRKSSSRLNGNRNNSRKSSNVSNPSEKNSEVIIRYGELMKKAVVTNKWKKRFFILTEGHLFYYTETFDVPQEMSQVDRIAKGQISLNLITDISMDKKENGVFQLLTPTRTYKLKLEGEGEQARYGASTWVASIRGAAENVKQQNNSPALRQQRGSFSSLKVDEMDEAMMQASQFKHPAKRLIDAETMYTNGKGPFQPAALDEYESWTPFDVSAWLYTVHMQVYSEDFYKQQVDGQVLLKMDSPEKALELGVQKEDVSKFLKAVKKLKNLS